MSFVKGRMAIYRPIRVLFDTPIYERTLQICWHLPSYKSMIALMSQLLRLQQKNQLPSEVTAEKMSELLVEQSKGTLRVHPEPDSAVVSTPPRPLTTVDEPPAHTASPEPDSAVVSTPPRPLTTVDEPPAHTASPEPDSAVVSTPPRPLTTVDEPPAHTASPEPDSAVVSTPPRPLTTVDEPPAHTASPEPDSAVVSTPSCPLTASDEPPSHTAILTYSNKMSFVEGRMTIYRPIRVSESVFNWT
uniref:Uncharacterized protein n=1 Tax=Larimichthys crocea TaxID=215358 RepID=A0A0F8AWR0_LARCR